MKIIIPFISVILFCISAQAEVVLDKNRVAFCKNKESSVETVTLKNNGTDTATIEVRNEWLAGFLIDIDSCTVGIEKVCSMTLAAGQKKTVGVKVLTLLGGDQSTDIRFKIRTPNGFEKELIVDAWSSDWGGCWEPFQDLSELEAKKVFNILKNKLNLPCEELIHPEDNYCKLRASHITCANTGNDCSGIGRKVVRNYYTPFRISATGQTAKDVKHMLSMIGTSVLERVECEKDLGSNSRKYFCRVRTN